MKTNTTTKSIQHYLGGIEYNSASGINRRVEAIYHAEGRFFNTNTGTTTPTYRIEYTIKDHLGNARVTFADLNANGKVDLTNSTTDNEIIQENHYYAFGMTHEGPWLMNHSAKDNFYQYNGKEFNNDHALNWNDYGARWYDPAVGRFTGGDPLAEKMAAWSPFAYGFNNPLKFTDPTGMEPTDIIIWYQDENGKDKSFRFNGKNGHEAPKNEFICDFIDAYNYNTSNGGGDKMKEAATNSDIEVYLQENPSEYNLTPEYEIGGIKYQYVIWNPNIGLETENGNILSPATLLEHEMDHAVEQQTNPNYEKNIKNKTTSNIKKNYNDYEEYRVITGSETKTAKANGEIPRSAKQSRYTHIEGKIKHTPVSSVISNRKKQ